MGSITFLGTGTPTPAKNCFGTCALVDTGDTRFLLDCGPAATQKLANVGFLPTDLDYLFLTHLHFDHCADVPCLLLSYWDQNASADRILEIFGPQPTAEFVDRLLGSEGAFRLDLAARINAPMSQKTFANRGGQLPRRAPSYPVHELDEGATFAAGRMEIKTAGVEHARPWLTSLAYRFVMEACDVTFAGDTGSIEVIVELAQGSHTLVVNCWNAKVQVRTDEDRACMATPADAAEMAAKANVSRLVLSHMGPRTGQGKSMADDEIRAVVASIFDGELVIASEGMMLPIA